MPDFGIPDIHPELAEPLGQVVIHWASVEYLISLTLGTFLFAELGGAQLITNSVSVATQTKWIQGLLTLRPHEAKDAERVSELLKRADELRSERNELGHGNWEASDCESKTAIIQTVSLERKEIIRSRLVTAKDISDLLADIDDWIRDFVILGRELGFPRHRDGSKSIFAD